MVRSIFCVKYFIYRIHFKQKSRFLLKILIEAAKCELEKNVLYWQFFVEFLMQEYVLEKKYHLDSFFSNLCDFDIQLSFCLKTAYIQHINRQITTSNPILYMEPLRNELQLLLRTYHFRCLLFHASNIKVPHHPHCLKNLKK